MPSLLIRLDPGLLSNPDADLRYLLPDRLSELSNGLLRDDSYDYEEGTLAMLIFMKADDLATVVPMAISVLEHEKILGNHLATVARVGTCHAENTYVLSDFVVVYPLSEAGSQMG